MSALPVTTPASADWTPLVHDLRRPHGFESLRVEGRLPSELTGTLYRNGPAIFGVGGQRFDHLFDGDGAITAVRLDGSRATGAVRLVETEGRKLEQERGQIRYGGFGTKSKYPLFDFFFGTPKNAANTSVLPWQGKLLALWEGGLPTELSLEDLTTVGVTDLGAIPESFSAHPHRSAKRKAWYNIGLRIGRVPEIDLFELPDSGPARKLTSTPIQAGMLHDFAVTDTHAVLLVSPLIFRPLPYILGRKSYVDALDWVADAGTEVIVIALDAPHRVRRFKAPAFYQWHFANAFDDADDIVVDFVQYPDFATEGWLRELYDGQIGSPARGTVVRARLNPDTERFSTETLWDRSTEFCVSDGRFEGSRTSVLWTCAHSSELAAATTPLDRIARIDMESGEVRETDLGPGTFPAEPVFVGRSDREGDGWLLTVAYDATEKASFLAVLDAESLAVEARAWFDQPIPQTFPRSLGAKVDTHPHSALAHRTNASRRVLRRRPCQSTIVRSAECGVRVRQAGRTRRSVRSSGSTLSSSHSASCSHSSRMCSVSQLVSRAYWSSGTVQKPSCTSTHPSFGVRSRSTSILAATRYEPFGCPCKAA